MPLPALVPVPALPHEGRVVVAPEHDEGHEVALPGLLRFVVEALRRVADAAHKS